MSTRQAQCETCVFLADEMIIPSHSGGRKEMLEEIRALHATIPVLTVVPTKHIHTDMERIMQSNMRIGEFFFFKKRGPFRATLSQPNLPYLVSSKVPTRQAFCELISRLHDCYVPVIIASREGTLNLAQRIKRVHPEAQIILRSHNDEIRYHRSAAATERRLLLRLLLISDSIRLRLTLHRLLRILQHIALISLSDRTAYAHYESVLSYVPPVLVKENSLPPLNRSVPTRPIALFVGALDNSQSVTGLQWFLEDVWPLVYGEVNHAHFLVVGRNPSVALRTDCRARPGVTLVGEVDDLNPYVKCSRVFVNPTLSGSGVNIKMGTAFSANLPVVTTRVGARGIPGFERTGLIARNSQEFATILSGVLISDEKWLTAQAAVHQTALSYTDTLFRSKILRLLKSTGST